MAFTKLRWFSTVVGLLLCIGDIFTDVWVAGQYFCDGHLLWGSLTLLFVVSGFVCTQVFSYAWVCDDSPGRRCRTSVVLQHILQLGVFIRYVKHLKLSYRVLWSGEPHGRSMDLELFGQAADLSMLRLFETFLESIPQLLLQLYIILGNEHRSILQYICIAGSFFNIAWATVEYRQCFRRSLAHLREMPHGVPTLVYLLYKLLTVTGRVLTLSLLLLLNIYCIFALVFLWLLGTVWTHMLQTDFCTSKGLERLYRVVVGIILIFTFFNVKARKLDYFWPTTTVIAASTITGLLLLSVYYCFLHPRREARIADEVDRLREESDNQIGYTSRMTAFLQC